MTDPSTISMLALTALIERQPFFKGLSAKHLQRLAESAMEIAFKLDESILQEGSPANRFYLILEGRVMLESEKKDRNLIPIQVLEPGDDLGWS